ncbi:TetR family transcriptional regulator [Burkholderia sp. WAC0059]|uniref:TetR family transcriptional regulator n=1 Tax=Burkholderia sp. WAC0059 TaxID=2066022 RepID=UPI000C7EC0D6|nr:TetR family transcriptional regulator [Burkholderia sp. WAC0059]PLZ03186.1 TetR family transcriptional regulator [Burkholderia sp. WAC0059]
MPKKLTTAVESPPVPAEGLRERKRRQTRERIVEAALGLFLDNGFDATTLDAIAQAADISRRTFFHYFDSKEAIVEARESDTEDAFRAALLSAKPETPPLDAVQAAFSKMISRYTSDEAIALDRLMRSTEALRARKQANYVRQEQALFAALTGKWPDPKRRASLRLVAMMSIGAIRIAAEQWSEEMGSRPLEHYVHKAFTRLRETVASH